ncbi:MAG TPA: acyl-CoA dehydrogenase family protein [Acidimicrobiales bacterium]|nr:acyl-CoA dehydrogenase family protein [Acidimicrobiales bacterium]
MDFGFTEEQQDVGALAKRILEDKVTEAVLREADHADVRFDRGIWSALADAELLGISLPGEVGGSGYGLVEQAVVLEQVGRTLAPVPVVASIVLGASPIAAFGTDEQRKRWAAPAAEGKVVLTAALSEPGNRDLLRPAVTATPEGDGVRLDGVKTTVPAGTVADAIVVSASSPDGRPVVVVVERGATGLTVERQVVTNKDGAAQLTFDGVVVDAGGVLAGPDSGADVLRSIVERGTVAWCAQQLGVLGRMLEMTAEYTKERKQFDVAIAMFQAVGHRLADAYIDVEGLRLTLWQAVWRLEESLPASTEVEVAKFWAAEAAHRVGHACVHVHGGTGIDEDYPVHRYFIAAKAIEFALGSATDQLLAIGRTFAATPE